MHADSTTREIPLTKGFVALVDETDYEMLSHFKWSADVHKHTVYAMRHIRYAGISKVLYMHQNLMLPDPGQEVDHANGDGLDNRRANLRNCTHAENCRNMRTPGDNTSGVKGVHWSSQKSRWHAEVCHFGVKHHGGFFRTVEEAADARDALAMQLHGSFARLNEVKP